MAQKLSIFSRQSLLNDRMTMQKTTRKFGEDAYLPSMWKSGNMNYFSSKGSSTPQGSSLKGDISRGNISRADISKADISIETSFNQ